MACIVSLFTSPPPCAATPRMSLHIKVQLLELLYRKALTVSSAVKAAMGEAWAPT